MLKRLFDKKLLNVKRFSDVIENYQIKKGTSTLNLSLTKSVKGDKTLFLDFQSTTPMDPRVLDAMLPYSTSFYGNAHSKSHAYGWEAEKATEKAREVCITNLANCLFNRR
jgi:selenocysteine lyase/cysteine desulfurase